MLVNMIGLVLSVLMSASIALAQNELGINITGVTLDRSGIVTVTGTVTCTEPEQYDFVCTEVTQPVGRTNSVTGSSCLQGLQCEPTVPTTFSTTVYPFSGRFVPGNAFIHGYIQDCTTENPACDFEEIVVSMRLRH